MTKDKVREIALAAWLAAADKYDAYSINEDFERHPNAKEWSIEDFEGWWATDRYFLQEF